jgi:uncharacterized protein (DUF433 family)
MGRNSGSDVQDAGTIRRSSSLFTDETGEGPPPGSGRGDGFPAVDDFECDDPFEAFVEAIHQELAPRSRLERVLADRVVLSAWTLHAAGVKELDSIRNPSSCGSVEDSQSSGGIAGSAGCVGTSPLDAYLVVQCLGKSLDLLRSLREYGQPRGARPVPSETEERAPTARRDMTDAASVFPFDQEDLDPYDISNEWPVVPRGRRVVDDPDAAAPTAKPVLAECWHDRLVFDLNVSQHSPVVKGTWVTVGHVLSLIVDGWTWSDILRTHPELNVDDIRTCLAYTVAEGNGDT